MGCVVSTQANGEAHRRRPRNLGDVALFFPGLRLPKSVDFTALLRHGVPNILVERLSDLRARASAMAVQEASAAMKPRKKTAKSQGAGFAQDDALRSLEDYLPVLLGMIKDGSEIVDQVEFSWTNRVDDAEETSMTNVWYEVLSVLHLMAVLCLLHANRLLLLSRVNIEGFQQKIFEENRRISVDVFLKAAGYLDFVVHHVLPRLPTPLRGDLPLDLTEGMLRALCQQALGQGVGIQLEMAIDSPKATLAVKRRFACEMVTYWSQAHASVTQISSSDGWGVKHQLYIKWKYVEAKAAAYYYHGLILNEGSGTKSTGLAVAALRTADWFLRDSRRACEAFNAAPPKTRTPPALASMKSLEEKIAKDASQTSQYSSALHDPRKLPEMAPPLPDFVPALLPEEYQLPPPDPAWEEHKILLEERRGQR